MKRLRLTVALFSTAFLLLGQHSSGQTKADSIGFEYKISITKADSFFQNKRWMSAKANYTLAIAQALYSQALGVFLSDKYPKDQIAICDLELKVSRDTFSIWIYDYAKMKPIKNRVINPDTLTPNGIVYIINKYIDGDKIHLDFLRVSHDTIYVKIKESTYLTQSIGSTGADEYMAIATYTLTELKGIKYVNFDFEMGDHAKPGTYSRQDFVYDKILGQTFSLTDSVYKPGQYCRTYQIIFDFDKATIRPESYPFLDSLATFLTTNKNIVIQIGRYGEQTPPQYSTGLTYNRAKSVMDYLISKGINKNRLIAQGFGDTKPIWSDYEIKKAKTKEEKEKLKQLNRRTEFLILKTNFTDN